MTANNPLFLQKSVLNVQIMYQSATMQSPLALHIGNGVDGLMEIDAPDNVQYEVTVTGDISAALLPVKVMGKLILHPQAPALSALQGINAQYYQTGIIVPGVITVSSNAGGWSYNFNNVVITAPFKGYTLHKVIDDYVFAFEAQLPNITSLYNLVNSAAGAVNLI